MGSAWSLSRVSNSPINTTIPSNTSSTTLTCDNIHHDEYTCDNIGMLKREMVNPKATAIIDGFVRMWNIPIPLNDIIIFFYHDMFIWDQYNVGKNISFMDNYTILKNKQDQEYKTCLFGPVLNPKYIKKFSVTMCFQQYKTCNATKSASDFAVGYLLYPHLNLYNAKTCFGFDDSSVAYLYANSQFMWKGQGRDCKYGTYRKYLDKQTTYFRNGPVLLTDKKEIFNILIDFDKNKLTICSQTQPNKLAEINLNVIGERIEAIRVGVNVFWISQTVKVIDYDIIIRDKKKYWQNY